VGLPFKLRHIPCGLGNAKRHRFIGRRKILTIISGSGILIFVNMISVLLARLISICGCFKYTNKMAINVKDFVVTKRKNNLNAKNVKFDLKLK
jgi:hypothetical protein